MRWSTLGVLALALAACGLGACGDAEEPARPPPNILFVFADDHGAQAIGAYGSRVNETPHIDRLADEGMVFRNCFCTNAICAPSRAVVLTGQHSHRNGLTTNAHRFDGTQTTFPKLLQAAGYQTAMIGKWHLKSEPTGFDHYDVLRGQGPYYNPVMNRNGEQVRRTGYTTDILTDLALAWLAEGRDPQRPFLLMLHHKAPHRNWKPGPAHLDDLTDVEVPEPATLFDDWRGRGRAAREQAMTIARHLNDADLKLAPPRGLNAEQRARWNASYEPRNAAFRAADPQGEALVRWKYQRYVKDYLRCVASIDDGVGRLLEHLDRTGLDANTVVVYSSDQGWYLGEHGWYDKRWMYEESLRMPLLVRWPGVIEPGSENADLVQNLDFAPTFLEMAGVAAPEAMQGRSLVALLEGSTPADWRTSVYYHYYEHPGAHAVARHYGVRTAHHKLIHFYRLGEWELYDLERDPDEMRSVFGEPAYRPVVEGLQAELERLRALYGVTDEADRDYDRLLEQRRRRK